MFEFDASPMEMKRTTPETVTRSECCKFSVTATTPDDFRKLDAKKQETLVMELRYICNKCGEFCKIIEEEKEG